MSPLLIIVGIGGVTSGGKTTLAAQLRQVLPKKRVQVISQDDYFLDESDPRHVWVPELNHINFDLLSSLDMEKMYRDVKSVIRGKSIIASCIKKNLNNSEDVTSYVCEKIKGREVNILIIEGFLIFDYEPWLHLFNLKYFFTLSKEECQERRNKRVYHPPNCPGYFDVCVWPEYSNHLAEVKERVLEVKYFDSSISDVLEQVLHDIATFFD